MRLTKAMKEDIVSSILRDIPKVDHTDKIVAMVQQCAFDSLPDCLKAVPKAILQKYLSSGRIWGSYGLEINSTVHTITDQFNFNVEDYPELLRLVDEHATDKEKRAEIKTTLINNIYALNTVKQFEERYPELVKYLEKPVVLAGLPTFPLTDMLTKAGWEPK